MSRYGWKIKGGVDVTCGTIDALIKHLGGACLYIYGRCSYKDGEADPEDVADLIARLEPAEHDETESWCASLVDH